MSDIKQFALRLPVELYGRLERESVALNMSVNRLIVDRLSDSAGQVPKSMQAAERTREIASHFQATISGADLPPRVHDKATCRIYGCLLCQSS